MEHRGEGNRHCRRGSRAAPTFAEQDDDNYAASLRVVTLVGRILRDRGVVRSAYEADTLRGNLGLPIPRNVHTVARERAARVPA